VPRLTMELACSPMMCVPGPNKMPLEERQVGAPLHVQLLVHMYHAAVAIFPCSSVPSPRYPEYIFADAAGGASSSLPSTCPAGDMPLPTAKRRRQGFNPPLRIVPKS
jgi:hypothetical protein